MLHVLYTCCIALILVGHSISANANSLISANVESTGDVDISYDKSEDFVYIPKAVTSKEVLFNNLFQNETISIFWKAELSSNDILITDLKPSSNGIVTTFKSHVFYAKIKSPKGKQLDVYPKVIEIEDGDHLSYSFGPYPVVNPRYSNSRVKYIDEVSQSIGARFKNLAPAIDIWYEDGQGGSYQGSLKVGQETTTNTYQGHVFFFTETGNKQNELARYTMKKEQSLYLIEDPKKPAPKELKEQIDRELRYIEEYRNRTGIPWLHYFGPNGPRPPPKLHMWSAPSIGHIHEISSNVGFWTCDGHASECQSKDVLNFKLEVVSIEPKVFFIENFFSGYEADTIIQIAVDKLRESLVGNKEAGGARTSATRTSRNAWMPRDSHPVVDAIYKRAGDLLKIDESILFPEHNAEMLQVVKYEYGQKYDAHHDWGVRNVPDSRFLTLLLYLNDQVDETAGGETSFPLAANGRGIKVHGGRGNAVLFYSLLGDGNADELSLHCGTPVFKGTKWVSNLWIWDPKKVQN